MIARLLAVLTCAIAAAPAVVAAPLCDMTVAEEAVVTAVGDGRSFDLQDGRHVRLAAIRAPVLEEAGATSEPLAADARDRLSKLIAGKDVSLAYADRAVDRHGFLIPHVFVGGTWLQQTLIAEGYARVETRADTRRCATALLGAESDARRAGRGIWTDPFFRVRNADELVNEIGTFQIVEGKVLAVTTARKRVYVNFGPDYRTDFTVTISPADMRRMTKEGVDPAAWTGKTVRVRGWLSLLNGPEIELTHQEQIEVLD